MNESILLEALKKIARKCSIPWVKEDAREAIKKWEDSLEGKIDKGVGESNLGDSRQHQSSKDSSGKETGMKLDLQKFREINTKRAVEGFKTFENVPLSFWGTALAGELGELCNMIKKMERVRMGGIDAGNSYKAADITEAMLEDEIGGIFIYLDLLSALLKINLEKAIIETFNNKSETYGFVKYPESVPPYKEEEAKELLKEVRKYHRGDGKYNFQNLAPQQRDNESFDAWQLILERIENLLSTPKSNHPYKEEVELKTKYPEYSLKDYIKWLDENGKKPDKPYKEEVDKEDMTREEWNDIANGRD